MIVVTDHAIARWRERFATYGDEGAEAVLVAYNRSRPVQIEETNGWFPETVKRLCLDETTGAIFVTKEKGRIIVTIMERRMLTEMPLRRKGRL